MKFRELIRLLEDDGWRLVAQRDSHQQYEHPSKPGKVTVAGKPGAAARPSGSRNALYASIRENRCTETLTMMKLAGLEPATAGFRPRYPRRS
ncbi:MAG: type II toxin-antitoxin system HicA family toxin [Gaiellaceae bacterium]